jgi:hypothetical protein
MHRGRALPQARPPPVRRIQRPHLRRSLLRRPRTRAKNLQTSMTHTTPLTALSCTPNLRAPVFSQALAGTTHLSTTSPRSSTPHRSPARRCLRPLTSNSINRCSSSDRGALSLTRGGFGRREWSRWALQHSCSVINGLGMVWTPVSGLGGGFQGLPIPKAMDMTQARRRYSQSPPPEKS